jgi:RiboL-PSP-HEPN
MSSALGVFKSIFSRADDMLAGSKVVVNLFNDIKNPEDSANTYESLHAASDMGRAAIVLAVASMDDYFTRKYADVLVTSIKKRGVTKAFCEILSKNGLDLKSSLELLTMKKPYRRIRTMAERYCSDYTTQRDHKIDDLFETIGLNSLSKNAQKRSGRKNLLKSISILVDRRNDIVHAGDLSRRGKLQTIDPESTKKRFRDLEIFITNCDEIVNNFAFGPNSSKSDHLKD